MKVLKFGAVWCPGCLVMRPIWKELEKEYPMLITEYYDFDTEKALVEKYKVNENLPTFIFLDKNEHELVRLSGEVPKKKLAEMIEEYNDR
ncbi:MAG TPA: thioredoxin family protein [bacterium]|nr:thioredoxin family protein [bacterium]